MCLNSGFPCRCLNDGYPCQPCRMTGKDKETEQAHLSNSTSAPGQAENPCEPELDAGTVVKERPRNWGWMLSGILCVNILILGCALVSGSAYSEVDIEMSDLQIFLIVLLILTSIWMIYYVAYTARQEDAIDYKDGHAGPVWLRGKDRIDPIYTESQSRSDIFCSSRRSGALRSPQYYHGHLQNCQLCGLRPLRFCRQGCISGGATGFHCRAGIPQHAPAHVFLNAKRGQLMVCSLCRHTFCGSTPKTVCRCRRT